MSKPDPGRHEIRVRVANLMFRVASSAPDGPALAVPETSRQFEAFGSRPADIDLSVGWGDLSHPFPGVLVFDSGGTWKLYRDGPLDVFRFWAGQKPSNPYLECRLDDARSAGQVILHREFFEADEPVPVLQFPVDEVLMVHLLGREKGIELHACGVVTPDGRGCLFAGQSGDGKTTTARLWEELPGATILSDDRIVVREEGGRFVMYGTPWHGEAELAASRSAPVDSVFVLEHGPANRFASLAVPEATALLAARSFVPFHDVNALRWSLGFLGRFVRSVHCQRFAFVPDRSAREVVRTRLAAGPPSPACIQQLSNGTAPTAVLDSRG